MPALSHMRLQAFASSLMPMSKTRPDVRGSRSSSASTSERRPQPDFAFPAAAKLISGAPISKNLNYYTYFLLGENGEVGGLEDTWVILHDAPLKGLGIQVGQFQIMDVVFPRELRLTRQDYLVYTVPLSDSGFDLTYQRGINVSYAVKNVGLLVGVVNGNGIGGGHEGQGYPGRTPVIFDNDLAKVGYAHLAFESTYLNFGWFGLKGAEGRQADANRMWRTGPDAELMLGRLRVFAQFLTGVDDNPHFSLRKQNPDQLRLSGGFVGATLILTDRWVLAGLYNRVVSDKHPLDASIVTAGGSYYWRRNFKLGIEGSYDLQGEHPTHPFPEHTVTAFLDFAY